MIVSVKFPILNPVYVPHPWPIRVGSRKYFLENKDGLISAVGVLFSGVPIDQAPTIEKQSSGPVKANLNFKTGNYTLLAERDIRAWQSLLAAYSFIDIDFDSATEEFKPENEDERSRIGIHNFSHSKKPRLWRGVEYAIFGRAFLALDLGEALIEPMSFYREGTKALFTERSIDAYNQFYLFIETQFCGGHTGTNEATNQLMQSPIFTAALNGVALEYQSDAKRRDALRFKSLSNWPDDQRSLVREMVLLRGQLRHHSLASPHRWDPDKQEHYENEARFLSLVCNAIAFPMTTGTLWDPTVVERFTELAKEMHMTIEVHVKLTIREDEHLQDIAMNMTLPQSQPDPQLAKFILTKALEELDKKSPGAELFAMRAWSKSNGTELFRYDVGPSIGR